MKALKSLRKLSWDYEFDLLDVETASRRDCRERAKRAAMLRHRAHETGAMLTSASVIEPRPSLMDLGRAPHLSRHGRVRLQQRGITMDQVLTVTRFGVEQRSHGASRFFLDKKARERIAVEMPEILRSVERLDIHVVLADDDVLITAAHRTGRLKREVQRPRRSGRAH